MLLTFKFSLLNKLDDIILSIIRQIDESKKKNDKVEEKKGDEADKQAERRQKHFLHMASLLLKTKIDAKFKLDYIEDFDKSLNEWLGKTSKDYLNLVP